MGDGDVKVSVSKSYISDRPKRLAQAKVQRLSRKTKNRKTKKRYARNLSRGNIRPKMRRQTGLVRVTIRKAEKKKEIGDLPDIGSLRFENSRNRDGRGYTMTELVDLTTRGRDLERGQNILWDKANRKHIAEFDNQGKGRYVWSPSGFALNATTVPSEKNVGKIMPNTLDIPRNWMTPPAQGLDWENPLTLFGYQDIPGQWRYGRNNVEGLLRDDLEYEPINLGTAVEGEWAGIGRALVEGKDSSTSKNLSDKQKTLMGGLDEIIPPISLEPYYAEYVNEAKDTADRIRRINEAHTATGYHNDFVTDLNPLSQSEVLSEGIPWRDLSEYVAPPESKGYSFYTGLPMDLSFRLLKRLRQTELGEYGVDAPSSYGPVTEYHGTMDLPNVLNQGIRGGSPKTRSNRYVPKNLRNEESINYTTNDAEKARKFAEERAISLGLNPADVGVVGVRGRDLSGSTEMDEPDGGILENTKSNVRAGNIPREYLVQASEPMDIAYQLLKDDDKNRTMEDAFDLGQEILPYDKLHDKQKQIVDTIADAPPSYWNDPVSGEMETEYYARMFSPDTHRHYSDKAFDEYLRYIQHFHDASSKVNELSHEEQLKVMNHRANSQHYLPYDEREEHPLHPAKIALDKMAEEHQHWGGDNPHSDFWQRYNEPQALIEEDGDFSQDFSETYKSKPMDMVEQLLKERRSAKALANKKKYDTKYESSPERVKYRVELNRERRRRGIYGSGNGKDVSHTKGGKLTLENQSTNRARHFKNRGTLRDVKVKK